MSHDPKPIRRCVCENRLFSELKDLDYRSVHEIAVKTKCGTHCGLCRPYLERMLRTGETEFEVMSNDLEA